MTEKLKMINKTKSFKGGGEGQIMCKHGLEAHNCFFCKGRGSIDAGDSRPVQWIAYIDNKPFANRDSRGNVVAAPFLRSDRRTEYWLHWWKQKELV